jgi:hypothetical protein
MTPSVLQAHKIRPSFRFSLRMVLIFVAIVAVPLAWVAKERRQSQHEIQVAEQLLKQYDEAAKHDTSGLPYVEIQLGGRFDERMEIHLEASEKQALEAAAAHAKESLSDWARAVLLRAAKRR